jgi:disulfide bond formation protein DsbB
MYPILLISGVGVLTASIETAWFILPFVSLGIPLETYHYLLQKVSISTTQICTLANPCNAMEVNYFGFLTIPGLCLIAFLVVAIGVWLLIKQNSKIISN